MKKAILILALALAIIIPIVYAQYPAVDFHQFYGTVSGVGAGTIITATCAGQTFTTTVDANNRYGYTPLFFVQGTTDGTQISFVINGQQVRTIALSRGSISEINLAYAAPAPQPAPTSGGGGGGGGSGGWRARDWYRNLTQPPATTPGAGIECFDDWLCWPWSACENGIQTRVCSMNDYVGCIAALPKPDEEQACEMPPAPAANCFDGILNQDETYTDCGGSICKQCDPGLSCSIDNDCITYYCNPATMLCDWKPEPIIEIPVTPPVAKKSYWWIWLIVFAALLAAIGIGISAYFLEKGIRNAPTEETPDRFRDVREYAQAFLKKGVPREKIETKLREAGWKEEDIEKALD